MFDNQKSEAPQLPKIYSKRAIMAFSVFFAPIFGGILLRQNLVDIGNKPAGNFILTLAIFLSVLTMVIVSSLPPQASLVAPLLNLVWAAVLAEFFYRKFFPGQTYEYKPVWKALIISVLVIIPFLIIVLSGSGI